MSKASDNFVAKCKEFWDRAEKTDGGLTVGQLARVIRQVAPNITDRQIADIFCDMDKDRNKILSWEEFSEVFTKRDHKAVQENELKEAFENIDTDGSGRLTESELRTAFKALGIHISDEALAKTIKDADVDGDGKIDFSEFLKVWSSE